MLIPNLRRTVWGGFVLSVLLSAIALLLLASAVQPSHAQEPQSKFSGTVVDVEGKPIAGARVFLLPVPRWGSQGQPEPESVEGKPTDAEGNFSIAYDSKLPWYGLVYKPNLVPYFQGLAARHTRGVGVNQRANVETIKLEPSKSITLTIREHDKEPAVLKSVKVGWCAFGDEYAQWSNDATIPMPVSIDGNQVTLDWLPEKGWASLDIETGHGKRSVSFSYEADALDVVLPQSTKLRGKITMADGSKFPDDFIASAKLTLNLASTNVAEKSGLDGSSTTCQVGQSQQIEVTPDGSFEIDCIVGTGWIYLFNETVRLAVQELTTEPDEVTEVVVQTLRPQIVKGRVVDEDGEPVAGVVISNAITDVTGKFEVGIGADAYVRIGAVPEGYLQPIQSGGIGIDLDSAKPGEPIVVPDVVVKKATPGSGRVIDEEGNPVVGAKVVASWIYREDQYSTSRTDSTVSDSDGKFTLSSIEGGVPLSLTAQIDDMASVEAVAAQFGADAQPVEIVVSTNAFAKCSVKVTDPDGQPIENAEVQMFAKTNSQIQALHGSQQGRVLPQQKCFTNADGVFEYPEKLLRSKEYSIKVSADGFVNYERPGIKMPAEGDLVIDDIALISTRALTGFVFDSSGKPVDGALVWSHGIENNEYGNPAKQRPEGSFATTDETGGFTLPQIHPEAIFVFVSKPGSISSGAEIIDDQPNKLTLRSTSESLSDPVAIKWKLSPDSLEALEDHLDFVLEVVSSKDAENQIMDALVRVNGKQLDDFIEFFPNRTAKAKALVARGRFEDVMTVCKLQPTAWSRARAFAACAKACEVKSQKIALLEKAAFEIKNSPKIPLRVEGSSEIIEELLDLGETETAKDLVDSIMPDALEMNNEGRDEFSKGWFAKAAVRVDYENSWNLIKDSKTSNNQTSSGFSRHCGNMAHELAASDPERAEKLLLEMDPANQIRYVPRVVCRMFPKHPKKALDLLDRLLPDPASVQSAWEKGQLASSHAVIATVIAKTKPEKAKELIGRATAAWSPDDRDQYRLGASLSILLASIEVDSIKAEEVFWKLIDMSANPNAVSYSLEDTQRLRLGKASELGVFLGLTGRFPKVQASTVDRIYSAFSGEGELTPSQAGLMQSTMVGFAAITMHDPKRAVTWHKSFYERIPENYRSSYLSPWAVITNTLSRDGRNLQKHIVGEMMHQWVIGKED